MKEFSWCQCKFLTGFYGNFLKKFSFRLEYNHLINWHRKSGHTMLSTRKVLPTHHAAFTAKGGNCGTAIKKYPVRLTQQSTLSYRTRPHRRGGFDITIYLLLHPLKLTGKGRTRWCVNLPLWSVALLPNMPLKIAGWVLQCINGNSNKTHAVLDVALSKTPAMSTDALEARHLFHGKKISKMSNDIWTRSTQTLN